LVLLVLLLTMPPSSRSTSRANGPTTIPRRAPCTARQGRGGTGRTGGEAVFPAHADRQPRPLAVEGDPERRARRWLARPRRDALSVARCTCARVSERWPPACAKCPFVRLQCTPSAHVPCVLLSHGCARCLHQPATVCAPTLCPRSLELPWSRLPSTCCRGLLPRRRLRLYHLYLPTCCLLRLPPPPHCRHRPAASSAPTSSSPSPAPSAAAVGHVSSGAAADPTCGRPTCGRPFMQAPAHACTHALPAQLRWRGRTYGRRPAVRGGACGRQLVSCSAYADAWGIAAVARMAALANRRAACV